MPAASTTTPDPAAAAPADSTAAAPSADSTAGPPPGPAAGPPLAAPFPSRPGPVRPDWIDDNGHLNLAYFVVLLDWATDALWSAVGLGDRFRRTGLGTFAVEAHTIYLGELLAGDETVADSLVVAVDAKRLHVAHELRRARDGAVAARQELMFLAVDLGTRRSVPWPADTLAVLRTAAAAHAAHRPAWIGRRIAVPAARPCSDAPFVKG